ncbi:MAG: helix-turn-helix domain-containing protein [Oscillospiraceae bacterium]|nr:helix-turn-helix domain-containing protein [Oscillospiraceae bacterium]
MIEWLRQKRQEKGITQEKIALFVGIARAYYTNIEKGSRNPSVETAKKIAEVLDFDWTRFFEDMVQ